MVGNSVHLSASEQTRVRWGGWLLAICCAVLMLLPAANAQTSQVAGTIRGIVTDQSGALVADADVTATNTGNNAKATTKTNGQGEYVLPSLSAGMYNLRVRKAGFKEFLAKSVALHTSSVTELNAQLTVGNATEVVTVEAASVQVQTTSASVGEVIDGRQVRELPLNGGNFVELTQLLPGVAAVGGPGGALNTKDKGILGGVDFAVNGNPSTNNLFLLDGANNNDKGSNRTILIYPAVDSIAEFKMLRNSYGPEYGQASGAIISIVTKSGDNVFHGSVNYFGRNDALNSYEFFAKRNLDLNGNPIKDELRRNDFGYSIGGPIIKEKLFFFWSEEWNREIRAQTHHTCAPGADELLGDFTTTSCGAAPNIPVGLQDPGNPLKIANPDPAGLLYAQMLPIKNLSTPTANGDNWFQSIPSKINWREENIKVDLNLTKKHMLTGKYTHDSWENPAPHLVAYWGDNTILPQLQGNWSQPSETAIGKLTSTLSSTLVNEAQFSYSHNAILTTPGGLASDPAGLIASINAAIPTIYPSNTKQQGGLPIFWSGFQQYGSASTTWLISPYSNSMDTYTINDDLTKIVGSHTLKAGVLWGYSGKNEDQNGGYDQPAMAMADWGVFTPTGNGLANLLIPGQVFAGAQEFSVNPTDHARWHDFEFYVGDTWKARRNLTLELGIRWSFLREPYDLNDAMTSFSAAAYDPLKPNTDACNGVIVVPGTDPCGDANALNGTNFSSGTPGVNRALRKNDNNAIAPRLGISWDPWSNGKTAIRAGLGQFFQRERVTPQVLMSANAPFSTNSIANRSLGVAPALSGVAASPGFGADPRALLPNSWQWNLSVERELAKDMTLELSYVGNRGTHLTSKFDLNQVVDPAGRLQAAFTPGAGVNAFRPMTNDGSIVFFTREAWSDYHSLQALFKAHINNRLQIQAAYTWSHAIANTELDDSSAGTGGGVVASLFTDLTNLRLDKGSTTINRPNIFSANAILYLPYLKSSGSFLRNALGGWEFSTIVVAQSGNSITVFDNGVSDSNGSSLSTLSGTGYAANQRPNVVPGVSCNSGSHGEQILNPAAFTLDGFQIGSIGNESRGSCWGPSLVNTDLALYKNWSITERVKLQFRLEMFNALNHAQFRGDQLNTIFAPSVTCGAAPCATDNSVIQTTGAPNSTFGQSTLTRGPREIQYGLKLTF